MNPLRFWLGLLLAVPLTAFGQEALTETFRSDSAALSFDYPAGWAVQEQNDGLVLLTNRETGFDDIDGQAFQPQGDEVLITFLGPVSLSVIGLKDDASVDSVMAAILTRAGTSDEDTVEISLGDRDARRVDFGEGLILAVEFENGGVGVMLVTLGTAGRFEDTLLAIAATFNRVAVGPLTDYDATPEEAIAELQSRGLIPTGGSLVFVEDYAFFNGVGSWFFPLASRFPYPDIVMGGELTYTVDENSGFEMCTLSARIDTDSSGNAIRYLNVGLVNDGNLMIIDQYEEGSDPTFFLGTDTVALGVPHHLLILLIDDRANVYVDGEPMITDFQVVERSGTYGLGLLDAGADARCEGRNIWVYQVPSVTPGVCTVSSSGSVNRRSGPGTAFDSPGRLESGEDAVVTGQANDTGGFIWWQLQDGSWVRNDVVEASGDCTNVPLVQP
jgi:hypothetical protein